MAEPFAGAPSRISPLRTTLGGGALCARALVGKRKPRWRSPLWTLAGRSDFGARPQGRLRGRAPGPQPEGAAREKEYLHQNCLLTGRCERDSQHGPRQLRGDTVEPTLCEDVACDCTRHARLALWGNQRGPVGSSCERTRRRPRENPATVLRGPCAGPPVSEGPARVLGAPCEGPARAL